MRKYAFWVVSAIAVVFIFVTITNDYLETKENLTGQVQKLREGQDSILKEVDSLQANSLRWKVTLTDSIENIDRQKLESDEIFEKRGDSLVKLPDSKLYNFFTGRYGGSDTNAPKNGP